MMYIILVLFILVFSHVIKGIVTRTSLEFGGNTSLCTFSSGLPITMIRIGCVLNTKVYP